MDRRLIDTLFNAYENIPYYRKIFETVGIDINEIRNYNDFQMVPVLKKDDIKRNSIDFIHKDMSIKCLEYDSTSGSTGDVLTVYWDKNDLLRSFFYLWSLRKSFDIDVTSKWCQFHPFILGRNSLDSPKYIHLSEHKLSFNWLELNEDNFRLFYNLMIKHNAVWISSAPSALFLFSKYIIKNALKTDKIKYIELSGEYLTDAYRAIIQNAFQHAKIVNQYGCRETNGIAMECYEGNMHCISQNVYVEIMTNGAVVKEGHEGDIYITSLVNRAMPVIRYEIGDRGVLVASKCKCGNNNPILSISAGRASDFVVFKDRDPLSAVVFWYAVQFVNIRHNNAIHQFHIEQVNFEYFIADFAIDEKHNLKHDIEKLFLTGLSNHGFGCNIKWKFNYYSQLDVSSKTGKMKYFTKYINTN